MKKIYLMFIMTLLMNVASILGQEINESKVDFLMNQLLEVANLPGATLAVSQNGKIVYSKGYGYADIDSKSIMQPNIRLRTASVSKVITATAVGRLISEGKLDIDAPIKKYVPYIPVAYEKLTTRQLAGHTAGMPHRPKGSKYKKKQYESIKETVLLMSEPLLFEPDTSYQYSTHAYNLIAAVIEGASGMSYMDYLKKMIFEPLGMNNTIAEDIKSLNSQDASLYYVKNDKLKKETITNASYKLPGAGFRSTSEDLTKMMEGYSNGFINPEAVSEMFKSHELINGEKTNVGIAWRTSFDAFGNKVIEHAGSWRGARTVLVHYPEKGIHIAIMVNAQCSLLIEETAHIIAQQLFTKNHALDVRQEDINTNVVITENFQGKETTYKGAFSIMEGVGTMTAEEKNIMDTNRIIQLTIPNQYAVVTKYGLLFMTISEITPTQGAVFIYQNRNKQNPTNEIPFISFVEN